MTKLIKYDRHARRRMKWRKISQAEVEQTLLNPEKVEPTEKGRFNAFRTIGTRYIRITYKETKNEILVISAVVRSE